MIVDFHTHIFPDHFREARNNLISRDATFRELFSNPRSKIATAEELIEIMDRDHVDVSVVMGVGWVDVSIARDANDYIIESISRYPDRLIGFAGASPAWPDGGADEADRCARLGLKGIGELHPDTQDFDLADPSVMAPLTEVIREHDLILTTHSSEPVGHLYPGKGRTRPEVLCKFIETHPDIKIVCAHWGGGLPFYALMPEVYECFGNVYVDTAASPLIYDRKVFATATALIGPDKVLLASDFPVIKPRTVLRQLESAELSISDHQSIAGGNAQELLSLK